MTDVSINGVPSTPAARNSVDDISAERLRTIVQDSHPRFLIGAGTPSSFFGLLRNVEDALTELSELGESDDRKQIIRTSIYEYFFYSVLAPNLKVVNRPPDTEVV
ncbi:hypothetical protein [Corynebacterium pacaense]|uniref:hypothetical protein n=1 Tax=Corynebacterium pacaense TaxID=1816684 RepID=UPI0009BA8120|nr:hypothetical protein [Corynebacterium pacaense]